MTHIVYRCPSATCGFRKASLASKLLSFRSPTTAVLDMIDPHRVRENVFDHSRVVRRKTKYRIQGHGKQIEFRVPSEIVPMLPGHERKIFKVPMDLSGRAG